MRTAFLSLLGVGLIGSATVLGAQASPGAIWAPRQLLHFTHPLVVNSETMGLREASCDQLYQDARSLLLQLGARASDIRIDQRGCHAFTKEKSIDVKFAVPVLPDSPGTRAAGPEFEAHWQTVALKGNCAFLQYATRTVLPLFTARNVKLISAADCERVGVGLYAQVLMAPAEVADSR